MSKLFWLVVELALSVMVIYFLFIGDLENFIYTSGVTIMMKLSNLRGHIAPSTTIIIYGDPSEEELESSLDEALKDVPKDIPEEKQ